MGLDKYKNLKKFHDELEEKTNKVYRMKKARSDE
jgi:hypothetical protein